MGKVLPLTYYLEKINNPDCLVLLEDFIGQNTKVKYKFKDCGCEVLTNLKKLILFGDFDKCNKCRSRFSLQHYLDKVDFNIELLEPYVGGKTKCKAYKKCGHDLKFPLNRISFININSCNKCYGKKPLQYYLDKIPQDIASSVDVVGSYSGQKSTVKFKYRCGHIGKLTLSHLTKDVKNFDFCKACSFKKTELSIIENIPKGYRDFIAFKTHNGFDSKIVYKNPCGHESKTSLGSFCRRKQFDYCTSCYNLSIKNNSSDYIKELPNNLDIHVLNENGRFSNVRFTCLNCKKESNIQIHALLKTKGASCRKCDAPNKYSEDDMKKILSEFMHVDKFSDRHSKYIGSRDTIVHGYCKGCNEYFEKDFFTLHQYYKFHNKAQCTSCAPKNIIQKNIFDFVREMEPDVIFDCRNQIKIDSNRFKEIDIYCPNKKMGIEYNGLLWHSSKYKDDKLYHLKKSIACADKDIVLLHIWSDRYLEKPEIYHSIIKAKLGKIDKRVFARNTEVKELSKKQLKEFFNKNHIDGHVGCITGWGLFYKDILIQAVSVRRVNQQNKKYGGYLEVARSCTLVNHLVVGGESKLLSVVERFARSSGYKGILNYVSSDFGRIPKNKWKFSFDGYTNVSYFYTDGNKRIARQFLQKRPKDMSEKDYANELNLFRVNTNDNLIYSLSF